MSANLVAYQLIEPLGEGGMGEVWLARIRDGGRRVAIKVDRRAARGPTGAAFLHEVAIIAGLEHPHIAGVLDHGLVDGSNQVSQGHFPQGARWLAMELAQGGSLSDCPPRRWGEVLHVMRGALYGLSHAHARGVVHRDIKPANLLLAGPVPGVDSRPQSLMEARVLLSDFGISERRGRPEERRDDTSGTPLYMAPEQIEGSWRTEGPWTDLYALGVVLYELCTGTLPFRGTALQVWKGHLYHRPPPAKLRPGVPSGVEPVLKRALAKRPQDRFRYATEMLTALEGLEPGDPDAGPFAAQPLSEEKTVRQVEADQAPSTWAARGGSPVRARGLSLFDLRVPRMVGRDNESRVLMAHLQRALSTATPHLVVLEATPGLGRTRLGRWLCERAHEQGRAEHWFCTLTAEDRALGGLRRLFFRELKLDGLYPDEVPEQIRSMWGPDVDAAAFSRWLVGGEGPPLPMSERRALVLDGLLAAAGVHPLIVVIDDAHHDAQVGEVARLLLASQRGEAAPLLMVLSRSLDGGVVELPEELSEHPRVSRCTLAPLDSAARRSLCRSLVGLSPGVAQRLEERSAGNPQFAVDLVRTWVDTGVLDASEDGLLLDRAAESALPVGVAAAWRQRVDAALAGLAADQRTMVYVAACSGAAFSSAEWSLAGEELGLQPDLSLLARLARRGLWVAEAGERWRFAHTLCREVLLEMARGPAWSKLHTALAQVASRSETADPERVADHLLEAGAHERALDPMMRSILDDFERGDVRDVSRMRQLQRCFDRVGLAEDDPRRGRLQVLDATRTRFLVGSEAALPLLNGIDATFSDPEVLALARRERARLCYAAADVEAALSHARAAEQAFRSRNQIGRAVDMLQYSGFLLMGLGRLEEAEDALNTAYTWLEESDWYQVRWEAMNALAQLDLARGRHPQASWWLDRMLELAQRHGMITARAYTQNLLGEWARATGRTEQATRWYTEAAALLECLADPQFAFPTLNLAVLDVDAGRFAVALARMERLIVSLKKRPRPVVELFARAVVFAAQAATAAVDEAATTLERVVADIEQSGVAEADLAHLAEVGGIALAEHGHPASRTALKLAIRQYDALGRAEDAARLRLLGPERP